MDMTIYIPTYKRASRIISHKQFSKKMLENVVLVTDIEEVEGYKEKIKGIKVIGAPVKGLPAKREWIMNHCKTTYAMMIDDDMVFARRKKIKDKIKLVKCNSKDMNCMVKTLYDWLEEGVVHVGVSARGGNNRIPKDFLEVTRMNGVYAFNVEAIKKEGIKFDKLEAMEDFYMTLSLLLKGYRNKVTYEYCWTQKSGDEGGCSEYRDSKFQTRLCYELRDLFPEYVKIVEKTSKAEWKNMGKKRMDVNIQWKKAYKNRIFKSKVGFSDFLKG